MKILCCGDLHARERNPRCRTDNFFETFIEKLRWVIFKANEKEVDIIVFPGDVFDSFRASDNLKRSLINVLQFSEATGILTISGQHDQRHHSLDLSNTPLGVLGAAGIVDILFAKYGFSDCMFYGQSYGEDLPEIEEEDYFNILITHRMIIKSKKLWTGQTDFITAKNLLKTTKFDLIVSGDNHQFFTEKFVDTDKAGRKRRGKDRWLINCGSLMRQNIDQADHEPAVVLFDTETRIPEILKIPIQPSNEIMELEKYEEKKERNEKLDGYIESLSQDTEYEGFGFSENLDVYCKENNVEKSVVNKIWEAVNG